MVRTLTRLTSVDTGLRPDHVLTASLSIPEAAPDRPRRLALTDSILARTRAIPGVVAAGAGYSLPIDGSNWNSVFWPQDKPVPPTHDGLPTAAMVPITAGYFEALGTRVVKGRLFDVRDTPDSQPVAIVNESLAARIWPGEDPIGKRLKQGWPEGRGAWREVIGVVGDIRFEGVTERVPLQMYLPLTQEPAEEYSLVVRTAVDPASISAALADAVAAVNRDVPLSSVRTMEQVLGESMARQRMARLVLTVFAALAVALAAIGLFGLVAHGVAERRHEVGVRLALGATRAGIVRILVAGGVTTAVVGAAAGVALSLALTRSLEDLLFGVEPFDAATFASVVAILLAVAVVACALPAYRASRAGITSALRAE
jgi:predicted permease